MEKKYRTFQLGIVKVIVYDSDPRREFLKSEPGWSEQHKNAEARSRWQDPTPEARTLGFKALWTSLPCHHHKSLYRHDIYHIRHLSRRLPVPSILFALRSDGLMALILHPGPSAGSSLGRVLGHLGNPPAPLFDGDGSILYAMCVRPAT